MNRFIATAFCTFFLTYAFNIDAQAQVINQSEVDKDLVRSLSFLFANTYTKDPDPLGVDFSIEAQGNYSNNPLDSDSLEQNLWSTLLSVRKGIYWNLSLSLSFLTPVNDNFQNGFSAGIGHAFDFKWGIIRSNVYFFSYNIEEIINQRGAGLTSLVYFKTGGFYTGLGLGGENLTSEVQGTSVRSSNEVNTLSYRGLMSILFVKGKNRISIDGSYLNTENYMASLSYGLRL